MDKNAKTMSTFFMTPYTDNKRFANMPLHDMSFNEGGVSF